MTITKKQTVIGLFAILLILAITPYADAQQEVAPNEPPPPPPPAENQPALVNELNQEENLFLVRDLTSSIILRLKTAVARTNHIVKRLDSRLAKIEGGDNSTRNSVAKSIADADQSLATAARLLENIDTEVEAVLNANNPRKEWDRVEDIFQTIRKEIGNARQSIVEAAVTLLQIADEPTEPEEPDTTDPDPSSN